MCIKHDRGFWAQPALVVRFDSWSIQLVLFAYNSSFCYSLFYACKCLLFAANIPENIPKHKGAQISCSTFCGDDSETAPRGEFDYGDSNECLKEAPKGVTENSKFDYVLTLSLSSTYRLRYTYSKLEKWGFFFVIFSDKHTWFKKKQTCV